MKNYMILCQRMRQDYSDICYTLCLNIFQTSKNMHLFLRMIRRQPDAALDWRCCLIAIQEIFIFYRRISIRTFVKFVMAIAAIMTLIGR